ncbi:hypothetical protein ACFO4N_12580 [Camelliibacillus cellulosilyticus]|uniref:Uncharacterized protein n=1 Tax=Camelliibacillus cellulosilyticus TaxID=2174486 RepID=A0ABV9GQT6_9BACL
MGHDISGYNKAGEEICYIRFSMGNATAHLFYGLLDAYEYDAGVSGIGGSATFSVPQVENALAKYYTSYDADFFDLTGDSFVVWERNEILKFLNSCLETAKKEGNVRVVFA